MIKKYEFEYNAWGMKACFLVDTEKFTKEHALATLEFFTWNYDKEEDPIDEVMKKYALEVIRDATYNHYTKNGVVLEFNNKEGYCKIDGSSGIELISIRGCVFDEDYLDTKISIK